MRKPPVDLVIDKESFRRARQRPEAQEALKRLAGHIADSFVESIPPHEWPLFHEYFKTQDGNELLSSSSGRKSSMLTSRRSAGLHRSDRPEPS